MATAIIGLSARGASSVAEMGSDIKGRVLALAHAHELIRLKADGDDGTTPLLDLAEKVLSPHMNGAGRIALAGPHVSLSTAQATGVALVLHELATNAVKHGSLLAPDGKVDVTWIAGPGRQTLTWAESGGPDASAKPSASGFGTVLAERTAKATLRGDVQYEWQSSGLTVRLSMPLTS